jgi:hypothetical protein
MKREDEMTEAEKKKCGCYFKPRADIQRKAIIKNLNETSNKEKLRRSELIKRR